VSSRKVVQIVAADGRVVCERCAVADRFWTRLRGLMGRRELPAGEGMLFRPGGSVHMFFMHIPLDVVFLDRELRVVGVAADLQPWRMAGRRGARLTLELAAGEAARRGIATGDDLRIAGP
jgi:uncharacterized membrane protein (UPF0127 family)